MQPSETKAGIKHQSVNFHSPKRGIKNQPETDAAPTCVVCMEKLGTYGGPASLACGHNGCLECLHKVQTHSTVPLCPLCRTPFDPELSLGLNVDFRDALESIELGSSTLVRYSEEQSGRYAILDSHKWQDFPKEAQARGCHNMFPSAEETVSLSVTQNNRRRNSSLATLRDPPSDLNIWNVLGGLFAIVMGKSKSYVNQTVHSELTDGEVDEVSEDLWASAYLPSAPPLLTGPGEDVRAIRMTLDAEPPQWVPDSASRTCMQCDARFRPLTRGRHHCRLCGGIFCGSCSRGKCLLPVKFMERGPQRVCDACYERLEPIQRILVNCLSNAAQTAVHDVTDWSCMRGWVNSPLGLSMEQEIYKATNSLHSFCKIGRLKPEKCIPDVVLRGAKGLAILTVIKAGAMMTYKLGTGLVVAKREDGTWSAPAAILSCGLGWGAQVGGELTDFIIVLNTSKAVKNFSGRIHVSFGAGLSAAAGPLGRIAEADLRVGSGGATACYTYSCSQGAFVGVSFESNVVTGRADTNACFYGDPYLTPADILFGAVPSPRAAAPLYGALYDLFEQVGP